MASVTLLNLYYAPDEAATAQLAADLGAALSSAGHDVVAIASNRGYASPTTRYCRYDVIDGVRVHRVPSTGFGRVNLVSRITDYLVFVVGAIALLLIQKRPDVVVVLTTPPFVGLAALMMARLRQFKLIHWSMDVYPDVAFAAGAFRRGSAIGKLLSAAARLLLRRADAVVALDAAMGQRLRENGASCVEVIHNWANDRCIVPRPIPKHPLRERWGWADKFVVLYSGSLGIAHDIETVLEAARGLSSEPNLVFAFIGAGPTTAEWRHRAYSLPNVQFYGSVPRDQLAETLTAADVHLVTLRPGMEGLVVPSKIYGILAAGRPAIYVGPPAGEVFEIIQYGCGTAIANGDVAGLIKCIQMYIRDEARIAREGAQGRDLLDLAFTRQRGTDAFLRLVERVVGKGSSR